MAFDLATAMRVSGNSPDMYENQAQAMADLQARAQNDPEFRRQMITQRARDSYQRAVGKPPPPLPAAPMLNQGAATPGDNIRNLLAQLRQAGVIV